MGQGRGCRAGDTISPIPDHECVLLFPLLSGVLQYRPRTILLKAYYHFLNLVMRVMFFGIHLFPALKSALSDHYFRRNKEVQKSVKNFLRSLGTDFYQDGFLKLISRCDKFISAGGEYVEK
ncbi:hypothetical protein AVEN_48962-1 [Araneus ventricosus]|uniref:Uncharacterized protein n=1 Tax=Araneus ventricosus TaxID=182803 RepID=A0A4Y2AJ86_ARAVE|nr:hypothetical protein AVEN_48962-1 [Araneus ventricosus]